MKYSEILKLNKKFKSKENQDEYKIFILSNIIVNPIKEIFEYLLKKNEISSNIKFSNYNNLIQDSIDISEYDLIVVFWEFNNLFDGFQYTVEALKNKKLLDINLKIKKDIDYLLNNLKKCPLVIFNEFTNNQFYYNSPVKTKGDEFCEDLNKYLKNRIQDNLVLIDLNKIFLSIGINKSIDKRFYYFFRSLYTTTFYYRYCEFILPYILSIKGKTKKAVIFDCDNTLWHGIIGEDGQENIFMNQDTYEGRIFFEVQNIILNMISIGIIVGICSKNNEIDIMNVIDNHPDMLLKRKHLSVIKANWQSKDKNIIDIANELNIGLDSIVFVDDSEFEIDLVKNMIPQVYTFKVPDDLYEYPNNLIDLKNIFFKKSITEEDTIRTKSYKEQSNRIKNKKNFSNLNDYLILLETKLNIYINNLSQLERLSQLVTKTNQFNLTTRRYSKEKIKNMIDDENFLIFSLKVEDKFGVLGLTSLSIIKLINNQRSAEIEIFLLSCRIIGRKIESCFLNNIIKILKLKGIINIKASYRRTNKNEIASNFYQESGFEMKSDNKDKKIYELDTQKFTFKDSKLFEVKIEK